MTLFISGPGGKTDIASGCTVEVEDSNGGVFKIVNPPGKMPAGISSADVIFVCVDSPGSKLVTMSSSSVAAVKLPDGGSEPTQIKEPRDIAFCYEQGSIYLSLSNALHYYIVSTSGVVRKYKFNEDNIVSSETCNAEGGQSKLCISDKKITIKKDCAGSSISGLVSGYVSASIAYLFDTENAVYVFDASAFTSGQATDMKKVNATDAWKGHTPPPFHPKPHKGK